MVIDHHIDLLRSLRVTVFQGRGVGHIYVTSGQSEIAIIMSENQQCYAWSNLVKQSRLDFFPWYLLIYHIYLENVKSNINCISYYSRKN